ncbi:hypothetical protein SEA_SHAM_155 [Streptomyces phage Sham]|nr:hypothetical protein SEA_SHAM_155 [Streptomyces phage Sham]
MKFVKVDEDAYEVTMNLDTILEIGAGLSALADNGDGASASDRTEVLGRSFSNAYQKFSQPETSEEVVETSDEQ